MTSVEKLKSSVGDLNSPLFVKKKDPAITHCRVFLFSYGIHPIDNVKKYLTVVFVEKIK
jgi:hypothetical protein